MSVFSETFKMGMEAPCFPFMLRYWLGSNHDGHSKKTTTFLSFLPSSLSDRWKCEERLMKCGGYSTLFVVLGGYGVFTCNPGHGTILDLGGWTSAGTRQQLTHFLPERT